MVKLSRCETSVPIPDPHQPTGVRTSEFSAPRYELTLEDDGTLTVKGDALEVRTTAAWYIVMPPKPLAKVQAKVGK